MGYLDDPLSFFEDVKSHLTLDGTFLLTVEQSDKKEKELSLSGRYLYSKKYVQDLFDKVGLSLYEIHDIDLRKEGAGFAKGFIVLAHHKDD